MSAARDRLVVDPVRCDGVGMCALLAPGLIELDRWGFPLLPAGSVPPGLRGQAAKAIRACPKGALSLRPGA